MTNEEREAIAARADVFTKILRACPGPWYWDDDRDYITSSYGEVISGIDDNGDCGNSVFVNTDDADFIIHAREDIPALLTALAASEVKRADLESELQRIKKAADELNAEAKKRFAELYDPHTPGPQGPQGGC